MWVKAYQWCSDPDSYRQCGYSLHLIILEEERKVNIWSTLCKKKKHNKKRSVIEAFKQSKKDKKERDNIVIVHLEKCRAILLFVHTPFEAYDKLSHVFNCLFPLSFLKNWTLGCK